MRFTPFVLAAFAALFVASLSTAEAKATEAISARVASIWAQFRNRVQSVIIQNNPFFSKVHQALQRVDAKYAEAKAGPEWAEMDETEQKNVYLKIALEELRNVRAELEQVKADKALEKRRRELNSELDKIEEKLENADADIDEIVWDPDEELLDDDEEAMKLAELGELENDEKEMGFSLSPETKRSIKGRTQVLLTDLLSNELKMLALWMLDNYLSGGKGDPLGLANVLNGLRVKVMEYVFDVIRDVLNQQSGFDTKVRMSKSSSSLVNEQTTTTTMSPEEVERQRDERSKEMNDFIASMI